MLNYSKKYLGFTLFMLIFALLFVYFGYHDHTKYLYWVALGPVALWVSAYEIDKNKGTN